MTNFYSFFFFENLKLKKFLETTNVRIQMWLCKRYVQYVYLPKFHSKDFRREDIWVRHADSIWSTFNNFDVDRAMFHRFIKLGSFYEAQFHFYGCLCSGGWWCWFRGCNRPAITFPKSNREVEETNFLILAC